MKIYVVDDERIIRVSLADELRDFGFEVYEFANANSALMQMQNVLPDIVITDLNMPEVNGIEFLKRIKKYNQNIYVVLMTAYSTVSTAIDAMKLGAYDYIEKPFDNKKMLMILEHINELKQVKDENRTLKIKLKRDYDFSSFIGASQHILDVFNLVKIVAQKSTSVLLVGETGTGKELLTNIIHYNSDRSKKPLIKVSCAILSREIFESELFGHEKGAFTGAIADKAGKFEIANGGVLYLDDIDDVPLDLQVKLLRALEEREIERVGGNKIIKIDIRLIASTKRDLRKMVDDGEFREDLFYRLNVFPINLPPLRERPGDIVKLTKHFVSIFSNDSEKQIDNEVFEVLKKYPFPGNVRELRNLAERLTLLSMENKIDDSIIPYEIKFPGFKPTYFTFNEKSLNDILEEVEKSAILSALDKSRWNKSKAADLLGLPASTLKSKITKFDL
ncbi:MAG: sigma-54-dependent Fis family transcriptional regulator [Bacteroidetes bacterium]|jgi:DNA-binding NtrC family response regulator|nr:sigma-54-dependent Fis family transcriptional regulator [Bacteroidota bacterium]MBT6685971.1 sigma-54-dependent Fis family transcriptional regulator [Bacteroidota bacterium]MBT7144429.1 sigma-54-dependent Fis family transcriptional regulator [Bacteroidota bacterium]MBT7490852.1 sigma-54-dependent Fis family transcriptional regulator [Bacteroidota bacterium]